MTTTSAVKFLDDQTSISSDVYQEVKDQLTRKLMTYLPGIPIDPALAIALYANSFDGSDRIQKAHLKKDGSDNSNPNNFGNVYEEQEVTAHNRESILRGSSVRYERTDNLSAHKESLRGEVADYAVKYDQHTDMVGYDIKTGKVVETMQLKHTRGSNILARDAYTTSENAPDHILVPEDMAQRHREKLASISERAHSEANRRGATVANEKLRPGLVNSKFTENPDKDNHPFLHDLAKEHPSVAKTIPYIHQGAIVTSDAVSRVGGRLVVDGGAMIFGGVLYELHDAWKHPKNLTWYERINRFLRTVFANIKTLLLEKGVKEIALDVILGFIGSMFRNMKAVITTFGRAIHQIWNKIWDYATGKIQTLGDLLIAVAKVFCSTGIIACSLALEEYLSAQFPWIPRILVGMLSAALGGIAIVYANKAIDATVGTLVKMLSATEAARLHREQVEAYIADHLPSLLEDSERLDAYAHTFLANQEKMFNMTFAQIKKGFADDTYSAEQFRLDLNKQADIFGSKKIDDDFLSDLEDELMQTAAKKFG